MIIPFGTILKTLTVVTLVATTVSSLYRARHPEWVEFRNGERNFFNQKFAEAIPHYTEALKYGLRDQRVYFHLGDSYLATERFRDAVLLYEQMLDSLPPHPKALQKLAHLYDQLSGADRAIELYKRYDGRLILDIDGSIHLAALYKRRGEFDLAFPLYTRVIQLDPHNLVAKLNFAEMLAWMKRYSESLRIYGEVIRDFSNDRIILTHMARTLVWSGDLSKACGAYAKALAAPATSNDSPGLAAFERKIRDVTIRWELARTLGQAKRFDESVAMYRALLETEPTLYEASVELATVLTWQNKKNEAFAVLETIPENAARDKVIVFLADHYSAQRDFDHAEALYKEYLDRFPNDNETRMKYADMLSWKRDHSSAREQYNQILDKNPPKWIARAVDEKTILLFADFHSERGEFVEAKSFYDLYISMYPEDQLARAAYARTLTKAKEYEQALQNYEILLARQPDNQEIVVEKARTLALAKRFPEATQLYRELIQVTPTNDLLRKELARTLFWGGEVDEPLNILTAFEMEKLEAEFLLVLGELHVTKKNFPAAESIYGLYLTKMPDDTEARFKYAEMLSWSKRIPDSLQQYEILLVSRPNDSELRKKYGVVLSWAGRTADAVKEFELADRLKEESSKQAAAAPGRGTRE